MLTVGAQLSVPCLLLGWLDVASMGRDTYGFMVAGLERRERVVEIERERDEDLVCVLGRASPFSCCGSCLVTTNIIQVVEH